MSDKQISRHNYCLANTNWHPVGLCIVCMSTYLINIVRDVHVILHCIGPTLRIHQSQLARCSIFLLMHHQTES